MTKPAIDKYQHFAKAVTSHPKFGFEIAFKRLYHAAEDQICNPDQVQEFRSWLQIDHNMGLDASAQTEQRLCYSLIGKHHILKLATSKI